MCDASSRRVISLANSMEKFGKYFVMGSSSAIKLDCFNTYIRMVVNTLVMEAILTRESLVGLPCALFETSL